MAIETGPTLRIGELSRRVGVSPELLRAWERRYGLLEPARTDGGLRLYSTEDLRRVRAMQAHLRSGMSAAEAAQLARSGDGAAAEPADRPALRHDPVVDAPAGRLVEQADGPEVVARGGGHRLKSVSLIG